MLPKNVHWSVLAQCDFFAVERVVQTRDRPAMRTVTSLSDSIFERKIPRDEEWKQTFDVICDAYSNLGPFFKIGHDSFGGYRLLYQSKNALLPPTVLRKNPIGFVVPVPEGAVTNLSVMSSERTGDQLLLLGTIRFINSDCSPNCEYDFSSVCGIVQLRVKRRINTGDEVFVWVRVFWRKRL